MEMYNEKKDKGFEIVSVNVRHPSETREETQQFQQEFGADFAILLNKTRADVAKSYGVQFTPTNVVIGKDGNIVKKIVGADMNEVAPKAPNHADRSSREVYGIAGDIKPAPAQETRGRRRTRQGQIPPRRRPPVKLRTTDPHRMKNANKLCWILLPDRISKRASSVENRDPAV